MSKERTKKICEGFKMAINGLKDEYVMAQDYESAALLRNAEKALHEVVEKIKK